MSQACDLAWLLAPSPHVPDPNAMPVNPRNRLLQSLSPDAYALLAPHLARVHLAQGTVLYEEGAPLTTAYLPETAIIALVTRFDDGTMVETATIGPETGIAFAMSVATTVALRRTFVQLGGEALVANVMHVRTAAERSAEIRDVMIWHAAVSLTNTYQLAACNARHSIEQRLARCLLQFSDRAESLHLPLKQEDLAQKLGVQRTSVTGAASALQRQGLIAYRRGKLEIRDVGGLRRITCECYTKMKRAHDALPRAIVTAES